MKGDPLVHHLTSFLNKNLKLGDQVLLGLSGGTDSLALFYLLLECQKQLPFRFAVAHVDHGWRKESAAEAEQLGRLAGGYSLPFYQKRLAPPQSDKNLEASCREERLSFFSEICAQDKFRAVVLAHQLDDFAETVLKNIFEGASLNACNGIREIAKIGHLEIWRPLLQFSKKKLADWLESRGLTPFRDETNFSPKFLRGRMRREILPYLESRFGKGITATLARVGKESGELSDYLESHLKDELNSIVSGPLGSYLDLGGFQDITHLESKFLIRKLCQRQGFVPSREIVEDAAKHLVKGAFNKMFGMGSMRLFVDRARIFASHWDPAGCSFGQVEITGEGVDFGPWRARIEDAEGAAAPAATDWKTLWATGKAEVLVPKTEGPYFIGPPNLEAPYPAASSFAKWLGKHRIPPFLRPAVPVIWNNQEIYHEFLTGRPKRQEKKNSCWQRISLIGRGKTTCARQISFANNVENE